MGSDLIASTGNIAKTNRIISLIRFLLVLLFIVCVFDPANQLLGLKYVFFSGAWILFLFYCITHRGRRRISTNLTAYLIVFVLLIPLISIAYYILTNRNLAEYDGYTYFKPYLFLSIVVVLYVLHIDLVKALVVVCTCLSATTLTLFLMSYFKVPIVYLILEVADMYNITTSGVRSLSGIDFLSVDFQSSPLIVLGVAYFSRAFLISRGSAKFGYLLLMLVNMSAMFVGATRNNMFVSILLPLSVFIWYSRKRAVTIAAIGVLFSVFLVTNFDIIKGMFDSEERSNSVKLSFYNDYLKLFSKWDVLLFGQGLGSFFNSTVRGSVSVSELTYFEFIRRFGILLCIPIFAMLFYPLGRLFKQKHFKDHYIYIGYFYYLIICFSNPFLMSSTGMLFLSLVLFKTFEPKSTFAVNLKK
jgi:hypothetical protein